MKPAFFLPALGLTLVLSGCLNLGEKSNTPMVYYVLNDAALKDADPPGAKIPQGGTESSAPAATAPDQPGAKTRAPTLLVLDTTTGSFYDTEQLVFSRSAGTRSQYQFARWTERPGKRFADLMRIRLDRQDSWNVSAAGGYVRGDLMLDTELVEFYHDAASEPGQMRLVLRAELVDLKQRALLGRRVFEQRVPLTTYDAAAAAQAANLAVSRALDDLTGWLATRVAS
jgi:cholesterol transport system auxiliary component